MDLSVPHFSSYQGDAGRVSDSATMYPTFAAPTPINMGKTYTGNILTPGAIPSPLNFPSITPPSSPYSFYGLYSPSPSSHVSPMYDPMYLKRLKSNPMFRDLQSLLLQECLQMKVPANLITTSWNLMQLHKDTPTNQPTTNAPCSLAPPTSTTSVNQTSASQQGSGQQVYMQHMKLQDKLLKVRIDPAISADGLSVENDYSKEVGNIEMERYRALNSCPSDEVKNTINSYFDKQRIRLVDTTEDSLNKLIAKAETMRQAVMKTNCSQFDLLPKPVPKQGTQPTQSVPKDAQGASLLLQPMDDKDKLNAVRKLKFNTSDEQIDDDDYLNCSVNSEDFEIDEIDVETVEKEKEDISKQNSHTDLICGTDILKQCIEESGISSVDHSNKGQFPTHHVDGKRPEHSLISDSSITTNESVLPDSTSSASDSPISMASAEDLTNQSVSTDGSTNANNSTFSSEEQHISPIHNEDSTKGRLFPPTNLNFGTQLFSTPTPNSDLRFANPDAISMALSEIQKLCGGPTVNFSPELRRDFNHPAFTPEVVKSSPLNEISNNIYGGSISGLSTSGSRYPNNKPATIAHMYQHQSRPQNDNINYHRQPSNASKNTVNHHQQQQQQQLQQQQNQKTTDSQNNNVQVNDDNIPIEDNVSTSGATEDTSNTSQTDGFKFENTPMFRTHRMLTPEATDVLSRWYGNHVQYPYPNDEEVAQLSKMTGITARQVKKWMANKRVRCFNTLSITGNQHPIKYKYQGQGRKRKAPSNEKENCDSTTNEKKPNYTMLTEEAKSALGQWYEDHIHNPYPCEEEKQLLANQCKISVAQVKSWFANKRNRTNNTKRQVPNYFIHKHPEYSHIVHMVGQKREEERMLKRRKVNEFMYIQPPFYL